MPGEPIVRVGDKLTTDCERVKAGTLFSMMENDSHLLAHDYGNSVVVKKLPLRDNHTDWEDAFQADRLRLCQGVGQTDWKRGGILRLVVKDKSPIGPLTTLLGLGWYTIRQVETTLELTARSTVQYRFNPSNPYPFLDPNTFEFNHAFTRWEIVRGSGGYTTFTHRSGGSNFSYRVSSTLAGEVMFTGAVSGGFCTGVPPTDTITDSEVDFILTVLSGVILPTDTFPDVTTIVDYALRLSAP